MARTVEELAATEPDQLTDRAYERLRYGIDFGTNSFPLRDGEADHLKPIIRAAKECDHAAKLQKLLALFGTSEDANSYVVFTESVGSIHGTGNGNATLLRAEQIPKITKNANFQQHVI